MAQNYVIFSHILWRLFSRDWVDQEYVIQYFVDTLEFFWGISQEDGYWSTLDTEQQAGVIRLTQEYHTDAQLTAALYESAVFIAQALDKYQELRFRLRDQWRALLIHRSFLVNPKAMEYTWHLVSHFNLYERPVQPKSSKRCNDLRTLKPVIISCVGWN